MLTTVAERIIAFPPPAGVLLHVESTDPTQSARVCGLGRFEISGHASNTGLIAAQLSVSFDEHALVVPLWADMTPADTFRALRQVLPPGYVAHARSSERGGIVVSIQRALPPTGEEPIVIATISDPVQQALACGTNCFEINGVASNGGVVQSSARVEIDGKLVSFLIPRGMTPARTARAVESRLPIGYRAIVEIGRAPGAPALVTIVRGADSRFAAA